MGKIVKYCSSCDEGFAERYGFCPDCGAPLQAFELNPVTGEMAGNGHVEPDAAPAQFEPEPIAAESFQTISEPVPAVDFASDTHPEDVEEVIPVTAAGSYEGYEDAQPVEADEPVYSYDAGSSPVDDGFHVTVIDDSSGRERNGLLLGATAFMLMTMLSMTVYSIFNKDYEVGSIGTEDFLAYIAEVDPAMVEIEKPPVPKKDDAGGGGGGGKEDPEPAAKGKPPAMMDRPDVAPDVNMDRLTNPTVTQRVGVQGPPQPKIDPYARYGILNGADNNSNGPGTGGGIGTGRGTGVGSGLGSGLGSGSGGGAGSGSGGGIGDGSGAGGRGLPPPPPERKVGPSSPVKFIAKPRAQYTDAARTNNVQGNVTLRVTFLASGQVGSISTVSGLPYGLTEQAIAAARQIRFEPKKVNGSPVTATMAVQYSFTIY